jgi:hypothetical protein
VQDRPIAFLRYKMILSLFLLLWCRAVTARNSDTVPLNEANSTLPDTTGDVLVSMPENFTVLSISYGGTGCPQGSVGSFISKGRHNFSLILSEYTASVGRNVPITDSRKNCQLNLNFGYPDNVQFSVVSQTIRGHVRLDSSVTAKLTSSLYFSGPAEQVGATTSFDGPENKDYIAPTYIPPSNQIWSPCGEEGALNIDTQISVRSLYIPQTSSTSETKDFGEITAFRGPMEIKLAVREC